MHWARIRKILLLSVQDLLQPIDQWETQHSSSTIKNTIAPLVRVLDEAVRDDLLPGNPARNRSRRSLGKSALNLK